MVILINSNCVDKSNWNFQFPPIVSETFQIFQRWTSLGLIEQHPNEKFAKIHLRLRKKDPSWLVFIVIERRGFRWFMPIFADPSGKQSGWFVRNHVPSAEARQRPCRPWRPVSGVLEQHATGTVHHLGNEHRRAGAEPSISLLILVLVVFAVEIAALWKKHVFFHRATRSKQFLKLKMCNGENVRNLLNKRV